MPSICLTSGGAWGFWSGLRTGKDELWLFMLNMFKQVLVMTSRHHKEA